MSSAYLLTYNEAVIRVNARFNRSQTSVIKRTALDAFDEGEQEWLTLTDALVWSHRMQRAIVIPQWFVTDLASIPWYARWLIEVNGKHRYAALPHDLLYCSRQLGIDVTREMADLVLLDACEALGVSSWKRKAMYAAVVAAGGSRWDRGFKQVFVPTNLRDKYRLAHRELLECKEGVLNA